MNVRVKQPSLELGANSSRKPGPLLFAIGSVVIVVLTGFWVYRSFGTHPERLISDKSRAASSDRQPVLDRSDTGRARLSSIPASVDFELWSDKRIAAYKETLLHRFDAPVALLEIQKIHLEVPVFNGTGEPMLNRGVGRIIGTARPGEQGNIGIAGHRDGFFRALKDIAVGDTVDLVTTHAHRRYKVDNITIVTPDNVTILRSRSVPTLTLVTCYPFYFHGDAPQRYILQCSLYKDDHTLVSARGLMTAAAGSAQN
ncbi:MAG TPA: class D sortase [Bryobacteraceae bacterium]|jgi:sortase A|nr:class D sortase [Bryobacteraceae bacterium]